MPDVTLHLGDCLSVLATLQADAVDAVVADPPAGISFMSRAFDDPRTYKSDKAKLRDRFLDFLTPRLAACLRVARPGARLLCWAIPRTSHWTGLAIEDAGWIIEDRIAHITSQGFPKAKSKLKPSVEDWWMARKSGGKVPALNIDACRVAIDGPIAPDRLTYNQPGTGMAGRSGNVYSEGWRHEHSGAAVPHPDSPRHDARGRYPPNLLLSHHADCRPVGTTRVKGSNKPGRFSGELPRPHGNCYSAIATPRGYVDYADADGLETVAAWACVAGCPVRALDAMSGTLQSGGKAGVAHVYMNLDDAKNCYHDGLNGQSSPAFADSGGASRFFPQFTPADDLDFPGLYCPKASRADRNSGIDPDPEVRLRSDLTPEQREYVLSELVSAGVVL